MTLQDELNALKAKSETRIPAEILAVMHRATEDLEKSGIKDNVPKVGDRAPDFSLKDTEDYPVSLRSLFTVRSFPVSGLHLQESELRR